jgi:hypothetical protein
MVAGWPAAAARLVGQGNRGGDHRLTARAACVRDRRQKFVDNTDRGNKPDHAGGDPRPAAVTFGLDHVPVLGLAASRPGATPSSAPTATSPISPPSVTPSPWLPKLQGIRALPSGERAAPGALVVPRSRSHLSSTGTFRCSGCDTTRFPAGDKINRSARARGEQRGIRLIIPCCWDAYGGPVAG